MEQRAQNALAPYRPAEAPENSAPATLLSKLSTDSVAHEPAALRSVVHLLTEAGRALAGNKDDARRYIVRAAALLQAEADFRDPDSAFWIVLIANRSSSTEFPCGPAFSPSIASLALTLAR